jgi:hypothetical protein
MVILPFKAFWACCCCSFLKLVRKKMILLCYESTMCPLFFYSLCWWDWNKSDENLPDRPCFWRLKRYSSYDNSRSFKVTKTFSQRHNFFSFGKKLSPLFFFVFIMAQLISKIWILPVVCRSRLSNNGVLIQFKFWRFWQKQFIQCKCLWTRFYFNRSCIDYCHA